MLPTGVIGGLRGNVELVMDTMADVPQGSRTWIRGHRAQLALSVRVAVAALASFLLSQLLHLPLPLWAVLTAIILTQMSFGGSFKATIEYFLGTLAGVVYAGLLATVIGPTNEMELLAVLMLAVGPAALLAALNRSFAAAPFTVVLVLLIPTITHVTSLQSALFRLAEVATGGITAVLVSRTILPTRANALMIDAAADMINLMAQALPELMAGFTRSADPAAILRLQDHIGGALARLGPIATEAGHERVMWLAPYADPAPLQRTLLRLRHDLVMIGRSSLVPLPDSLKAGLAPPLADIAETAHHFLRDSADALQARRAPPSLEATTKALEAYLAKIDVLRRDGLLRELPSDAIERIFTFGFSLEQLQKNFSDLVRCISEWTQPRIK
jgi:uncharacterized membrane protein YccC